jgi:hypothetical protein
MNSSSFGAGNYPLFDSSKDLANLVSIGDMIESGPSWLWVDGISPINRAFPHVNVTQNLAAIAEQDTAITVMVLRLDLRVGVLTNAKNNGTWGTQGFRQVQASFQIKTLHHVCIGVLWLLGSRPPLPLLL